MNVFIFFVSFFSFFSFWYLRHELKSSKVKTVKKLRDVNLKTKQTKLLVDVRYYNRVPPFVEPMFRRISMVSNLV